MYDQAKKISALSPDCHANFFTGDPLNADYISIYMCTGMTDDEYFKALAFVRAVKYNAPLKSVFLNETCFDMMDMLSESKMFKLEETGNIRVSSGVMQAVGLLGLVIMTLI